MPTSSLKKKLPLLNQLEVATNATLMVLNRSTTLFTGTSWETGCRDRRIVILEWVEMAMPQKNPPPKKTALHFWWMPVHRLLFHNKYYVLVERNIIC